MTIERNMQERVNEICNELYSKSEKVSVRVILTYLPDVSSTSTVHKYYANWRKELEANEKSLYDKLGFSSEFTQMFMKEISRFSVEAEQRYKGLADEANEQRDTAIDELSKAEDRQHKQTAVVEQQEKDLLALKVEASANINSHKAELEKVTESHNVLILELRRHIERFEKDLANANRSNELLRTELAKSELKLESNQSFVNEVKEKREQLESQNAELRTNNQTVSTKVAKLETKLEGSVALIDSLRERLSDFEENHSTLQTRATESEAGYKAVVSELADHKVQVQNQSQKIGSLEEMNNQQKRYIKQLEKANSTPE